MRPIGLRAGVGRSRVIQLGMTLIEIMVVVLIMGLIMGTVGYAVFKYYKKAQVRTTKMRVLRVLDVVQGYMAHPPPGQASRCPDELSVLAGEHVKPELLRDAWRRPLRLTCTDERICVYSLGDNGTDENGGGDDIRACEKL
jgi:prepilin-type N-terminal cleavage/methylation domain-containing protein